MAKEGILTQEGREALEAELHHRETTVREEIGERIKVARDFGDISENSEYDDAKDEQGRNEARIAEINQILSNASVIDTPKRSSKASIGSTVTIKMANGSERELTIVGSAEADPKAGRISNESPVGAAILGRKKNEQVSTTGPTGRVIEFTITKIVNN